MQGNPMLKIMSLKRNVQAARKEREKEQSRLKAGREPVKASADVLERHPNDPLVLIKFREIESLRERSLLVPVGVHLSELKQQACNFFNYPPDKSNGVKLGYPKDGIERYDAEGDSILDNMDSDEALQEALKHWNSGVSERRDSSLVHFTLHSAYNIANPTRFSDVIVGARLLFEMTVVPTNIHSLQRLGQLEALEKTPGVLLSAVNDVHVAAGAHMHWHLSFDSLLYRRRRCVSRKDHKLAKEAEAALAQALEGEVAALSLARHGNKTNTERALQVAKKQQRIAEAKAHRSIINPPTMLKLMRVLSVVCAMRRHRLGPPSRLRPDAIEAEIEELYDPEERLQREASARRIQQIARTRKARQEVEKRRQNRLLGNNVDASSVDSQSIDFGNGDDASVSSYGSGKFTMSSSSASWYLEPSLDEEDDTSKESRIYLWNANQYTKGFFGWLNRARQTIKSWNSMVVAEPSSLDLLLYFTVGSLWMNLRDNLTRKIHGVHAARGILELATTPVPLTKSERSALARQAKQNAKTSGAAAAFGSGKVKTPKKNEGDKESEDVTSDPGGSGASPASPTSSGPPSRPVSPDATSIAPEFGGMAAPAPVPTGEKDAVQKELEVLIGYQKRLQGISMHMLCYLVKISEPIRMSLARHHHILCLISHTFSIRTVESRSVQMAAVTVLARLVQQQQHRELYARKDLAASLWDTVLLGLKLDLHPQISQQQHSTEGGVAQNKTSNSRKDKNSNTKMPHVRQRVNPEEQKKKNENNEIEYAMLMALWGICHALEQISDVPPKPLHMRHRKKHRHGRHKHHHHKHKHQQSQQSNSSSASVSTNATHVSMTSQTTHQAALQTTLVHPAITVAQSIQQSTEIIPTVLSTMLSQTKPPQAAAAATKALFAHDASNNTLLDNLTAICGWTRDFGFSRASQRCSISILTICASAAPMQVALKLGVPGLTRLLMFAAGKDNFSNTSAKKDLNEDDEDEVGAGHVEYKQKNASLSAEAHLEQHNVMHDLRVQEAAVATLGHLSKAAGNAAKKYKPRRKPASGGDNGGGKHHHHHHHHHHGKQHKQSAVPSSGGSLSNKIKASGLGKVSKFGGLAVGVVKIAEDERSKEEKLVGIFRRFVDEAGGVEKLSNLRKSWESRAKILFQELDRRFPKTPTSPQQYQNPEDDFPEPPSEDNNEGGGGENNTPVTPTKSVNSDCIREEMKDPSLDGSQSSAKSKSASGGTHIGGGRFSPDAKNAHQGILLELKLKAFRGMLQSTSLIIVNLSSLPQIELEDPTSPTSPGGGVTTPTSATLMGTNGKPLPQRTARGRALLKKLQGAVSPRDRVKKVIEMLWSDKRSIAEQGCAALWLLARDKGPRAVVVDLCLQSGVFGGVLPIVPRLHALITATPNLGLRTWSLSAIWMLCEDVRFRNQPGPFISQELVPLLVRHIVEYASIFVPKDDIDDIELKSRRSGGSPSNGAAVNNSPNSSKSPNLFQDDSDDEEHFDDETDASDSDEYSDDDEEERSRRVLDVIDEDDEEEDLEEGMDPFESIAAKWTASDLKHHCERQRLAGVSLGCLLQLTHFHPATKAILQRDPMNSGLEGALVGLLERKATIGAIKRSAYHILFLICSNHPASMARLLCTVTEMLPNAAEINDHDHDMELLLREHSSNVANASNSSNPMGIPAMNNIPDVKLNATNTNAPSDVDGGNFGGGNSSFIHGSVTESSAYNVTGVAQPASIKHCLYLEHAALALLDAPYESKKQIAAAAASALKTVQPPQGKAAISQNKAKLNQQVQGKDLETAKEERRKCAAAGSAALAAAEALVLGQFQGPPPKSSSGNTMRSGEEDQQHDAAKGDGTADEDDAALCFAMAALVDLTARRDVSKSTVVARAGAKLAIKYFRARPSLASLTKQEMLAVITSHSNAMHDGNNGGVVSQAVGGNGGGEDMRMVLGVWKRIYPLHLLLNVSSLEVCRLKTCIASFEDLIIATRGPRLAKKLNKLALSKLQDDLNNNKNNKKKKGSHNKNSSSSVGASTIATNDLTDNDNGGDDKKGTKNNSPIEKKEQRPDSGGELTSDDEDDYSSSSDEEDGADAWARQLAFGCLANLSRNTEARQRIFKYALGIGLMPPGVRKRGAKNLTNKLSENNVKIGWGAGGGAHQNMVSLGAKPKNTRAPPLGVYLGEEMADALHLLKINRENSGLNKTQRPATTGSGVVGQKRQSESITQLKPGAHISTGKLLSQWNKESRLKANNADNKSTIAASKASKKRKQKEKMKKMKAQELKTAIDEANEHLKETKHFGKTIQHTQNKGSGGGGGDDDDSTIASENMVGLPPKPNITSNWKNDFQNGNANDEEDVIDMDSYSLESFSMSTIDAAQTESEHLSNVMAWMFSSEQFPKPKGAPRRIAVKVPEIAPTSVNSFPDVAEFKSPNNHNPDISKRPLSSGGNAQQQLGYKNSLAPLSGGGLNRVGAMGENGQGGLAAARRRRSDGHGTGFEIEGETQFLKETVEVYPSGADAWHPAIAAAALKSNNHSSKTSGGGGGGHSSSGSVSSSLASSLNESKRKKALFAANNSLDLNSIQNIDMNVEKPRKLKGAEKAVDPRHTRKAVAVVLSPRASDGNRFLWGTEAPEMDGAMTQNGYEGNGINSTFGGGSTPSRSVNGLGGVTMGASTIRGGGFENSTMNGASSSKPSMGQTAASKSLHSTMTSTVPSSHEIHDNILNAAYQMSQGSVGNITGSHTVAPPPQPASSGRIWMWPHVEGSKVGHRAGLTPFRVQGPPDISLNGGGTSSQSYANSLSAEGQPSMSHGFHFYHRPSASALPFPAPPLPRPLPPTDLGRIFQRSLPTGAPPLVPAPDMGGEGDPMELGSWALILDYGHQLEWTRPPPWILPVHEKSELTPVKVGDRVVDGGIPLQPAYFLSLAPPKDIPVVVESKAQKIYVPSHRQPTSVWVGRPTMNDGRDFMDSGALYKKALNRDWRRLLNEDRFFKFVDREDDHAAVSPLTEEGKETVEDELDEVKEVLFDWAAPLLRMFDYYCLLGSATTNTNDNGAFAVSENCYHSMCNDLQVVDKRKCTKAFLSNVFVQVNVEVDDGKKDDKTAAAQNFVNEDRALMRFEFLEALVRIAVNKYKSEVGGDVSEALQMMFENHIGPFFIARGDVGGAAESELFDAELMETANMESEAIFQADEVEKLRTKPVKRWEATGKSSQNLFNDPNTWRAASLYNDKVDDTLKSHQRTLELIYTGYSRYETVTRGGITQKSKAAAFSLQSWMDFLDDAKLIQTAKNQHPWGTVLTQREARLVFFLSRMNVVDEVKHRSRCTSLDVLEFFEALCRISEILAAQLPMAEELEEKGAKDIIEFESLLKLEAKTKPNSVAPSQRVTSAAVAAAARKNEEDDDRGSSESGSDSEDSLSTDDDDDPSEQMPSLKKSKSSKFVRSKTVNEDDLIDYAAKQKYVSRRLYERLEMLIRVIGGHLGMLHKGQLIVGKTYLKFLPRYIADPKTLSTAQ